MTQNDAAPQLAAIQARLDVATPRPWSAHGEAVIASHPTNLDEAPVAHADGYWFPRQASANAIFIAHAPADIAFLLGETARLRARLAELDGELETMAERAAHGIPYYAFGDNEAAVQMATRLADIETCVNRARVLASGEEPHEP